MIADKELVELQSYRRAEQQLPINFEPSFASLVVGVENESLPIHRWFRFKEGYSGELLSTLLKTYFSGKKDLTLLDPFSGMGTTLLSAQTIGTHCIRSFGIEYNPFIRFAASTKLSWPFIDSAKLLKIARSLVDVPIAPSHEIPILSGFSTERCMSHYIARRLIGIRNAIHLDGDTPTHNALLLGLASCIEPLSRTRKDGRALRLVDRGRQSVWKVLMDKWVQMGKDVESVQKSCPRVNPVQILLGDGRKPLMSGVESDSIDLVLTSPPYLNNIDYSEVYKLELWLMGYVGDGNDFLQLRKGTLRSHPTSELGGQESSFMLMLANEPLRLSFGPILEKLDTRNEKWRRKLFIAYFSDMHTALKEQYRLLRNGGYSFVVVGNSMHGGQYAPYVVATDILLCELARNIGFTVQKLLVARPLRRRLSGNHFLRDSVIVLRKPNA